MKEKQKLRFAIMSLIFLLLANTIFFHSAEKWGWVDSFYFSGITMMTIGYGDFVPTHDITKIIVVFDAMISIGLFLYALSILTEMRIQSMSEWKVWKLKVEDLPKHMSKAHQSLKKAFPIDRPPPARRRMKEIFRPTDSSWYEQHMKTLEKQKKEEEKKK